MTVFSVEKSVLPQILNTLHWNTGTGIGAPGSSHETEICCMCYEARQGERVKEIAVGLVGADFGDEFQNHLCLKKKELSIGKVQGRKGKNSHPTLLQFNVNYVLISETEVLPSRLSYRQSLQRTEKYQGIMMMMIMIFCYRCSLGAASTRSPKINAKTVLEWLFVPGPNLAKLYGHQTLASCHSYGSIKSISAHMMCNSGKFRKKTQYYFGRNNHNRVMGLTRTHFWEKLYEFIYPFQKMLASLEMPHILEDDGDASLGPSVAVTPIMATFKFDYIHSPTTSRKCHGLPSAILWKTFEREAIRIRGPHPPGYVSLITIVIKSEEIKTPYGSIDYLIAHPAYTGKNNNTQSNKIDTLITVKSRQYTAVSILPSLGQKGHSYSTCANSSFIFLVELTHSVPNQEAGSVNVCTGGRSVLNSGGRMIDGKELSIYSTAINSPLTMSLVCIIKEGANDNRQWTLYLFPCSIALTTARTLDNGLTLFANLTVVRHREEGKERKMHRGGCIGGFVLQSTFENILSGKRTPFLIDKFIILASSSSHRWDQRRSWETCTDACGDDKEVLFFFLLILGEWICFADDNRMKSLTTDKPLPRPLPRPPIGGVAEWNNKNFSKHLIRSNMPFCDSEGSHGRKTYISPPSEPDKKYTTERTRNNATKGIVFRVLFIILLGGLKEDKIANKKKRFS
ncbi:hypothetical protein GQR58_006413 [Nymphon striatum]|nr:hypothetical protein GQR58_006413 [Nymphon striatum]